MGADLIAPLLLIVEFVSVSLSLAVLIFAIGLDATLDDLLFVFRRPKLLLKGMLSVYILVPSAALIIITLLPLTTPVKAGIMLMAISPIPPTLPNDPLEAATSKSYIYGLYIALIAVAAVFVPASLMIARWIYGVSIWIPPAPVTHLVSLQVLIPLILGLAVSHIAPTLASRTFRWIVNFSLILLIVGELPVLISTWPTMVALVGNGTVLAMAFVGLVGLVSGHFLAGGDPDRKSALAIASANRHPGIAALIAGTNFADEEFLAAILLFLVTSAGITLLYGNWWRLQKFARR